MPERRQMQQLTRSESLALLGGVRMGRIVFTQRALPAIRPVNHLVDGGDIIIRTHLGAAVLERDGVVVAYEADDIDQQRRLGWSVVVTGLAQLVREPDLITRYQAALLPWIDLPMDQVLRVRTDLVTGFRFV